MEDEEDFESENTMEVFQCEECSFTTDHEFEVCPKCMEFGTGYWQEIEI